MRSLREVIDVLRREIHEAAGLRAGRVTVALQVAIEEESPTGPLSIRVITSHRTGSALEAVAGGITHTVTIELEPGATESISTTPPTKQERQPDSVPEMMTLLRQMFGPPGFDNAARASVFRESVEELAPKHLKALLAAFREDRSEVPLEKFDDPVVGTARTRIGRLLRLGPSGFAGGVEAMLRLFDRYSTAEVLETILRQWKTQSEWMDAKTEGQ